jgi:hypothetical protein
MRNRLVMTRFVLAALVCVTLASGADAPPREDRTHYELTSAQGAVLAEATVVYRFADTWDGYIVLYRSSNGDELVLEQRIDYESKMFELTIRDVTGKDWVKAKWLVPYSGATREAARVGGVDQLVAILKNSPPPYVTIETAGGGRWEGYEEDWIGDRKLDLVRQLRRSIPFELLEAVERSRVWLFSVQTLSIGTGLIVDHFTYELPCTPAAPIARIGKPDCEFDRSFGLSCSEEQAERASAGDQVLERY